MEHRLKQDPNSRKKGGRSERPILIKLEAGKSDHVYLHQTVEYLPQAVPSD
jgi:hypothetical protein